MFPKSLKATIYLLQTNLNAIIIIMLQITNCSEDAMKEIVVTESQINEVKALIAKKAIESWRMLPAKTRCYVSIDDMISDGVVCVTKFLAHGKYNPKKGKITTILWVKLTNFYARCAELLNTQKRFDGNDLLIEDLKAVGIDVAKEEELPETREHIREVFLGIYMQASDELRESMRRWFLSIDNTKVHTKSNRFVRDKREFKQLADRYGMDIHDCRTLIHCVEIRNEVISRLPEYTFIEL